jgi:hypothetical protein
LPRGAICGWRDRAERLRSSTFDQLAHEEGDETDAWGDDTVPSYLLRCRLEPASGSSTRSLARAGTPAAPERSGAGPDAAAHVVRRTSGLTGRPGRRRRESLRWRSGWRRYRRMAAASRGPADHPSGDRPTSPPVLAEGSDVERGLRSVAYLLPVSGGSPRNASGTRHAEARGVGVGQCCRADSS